MAVRKPKVGDPAIIDGSPYTIAVIKEDNVEFHCLHRAELRKELQEIREVKNPEDREKAKKSFMARNDFTPMDQDMKVRLLECGHNHLIPGGSSFHCSPDKIFWVSYSSCWSANGRLLERNQELDKDFHTLEEYQAICLAEDIEPDPLYGSSVKSRAKLFRDAGKPYDTGREIAAHIAVTSQGGSN